MTMAYSQTTAQEMMTLSAISYVTPYGGGNPSASDITAQLGKAGIAISGQNWHLVWGPATSAGWDDYDNMMFVVQRGTSPTYALVIRGTVFNSIDSWLGDVPTGQNDFSDYTGGTKTAVSNGFHPMFENLLKVSSDGDTLEGYIKSIATSGSNLAFYVTGHSQGAGLTPIFLAWLNTKARILAGATLNTAGYGFAPPTAGDSDFAAYMTAHANSYLIVNPNDIVPFGYAKIKDVRTDSVPIAVPEHMKVDGITVNLWDAIDAASDVASDASKWPLGSGPWAQAGQVITLPGQNDPHTSDSYFTQVEVQHNHNSYLALLGANQTDIPDPSPFTKE